MKTIEQLARKAETARTRCQHLGAMNTPLKIEDRIRARIEYEEARKEATRSELALEQAIREEKSN